MGEEDGAHTCASWHGTWTNKMNILRYIKKISFSMLKIPALRKRIIFELRQRYFMDLNFVIPISGKGGAGMPVLPI
jgi:hypothetical protein